MPTNRQAIVDAFKLDFTGKMLKTRATPKQARARQRVFDILMAAAEVLKHHAAYDLSTTLIAAQAGVPVSSVYRYFPTIEDLEEELYLHAVDELQTQLTDVLNDAAMPDWRLRLRTMLELTGAFLQEHPYYSKLLLLLSAKRDAQSVSHAANIELINMLAERWAQGEDGFSGGDAVVVATTTVQIALSMEELIALQNEPEKAMEYFDAMMKVLERYLEIYLHTDNENALKPNTNAATES